MYCSNCGTKCEEGAKFCGNCGAVLGSDTENTTENMPVVTTTNNNNNNNNYQNNNSNANKGYPNTLPPEYKPISAWGYFGYQLLFSIPCAGFIILIVFAVGGTENINLRNFARSYFCFYILLAVIILLLFGISACTYSALGTGYYYGY